MSDTFDKQMISNISDIYKRIEAKPSILLCNPTFELIGDIGLYTNSQCTLRFNDKSELSFTVPYKYYNELGEEIINNLYPMLERTRLLHIDGMGWWYINEVRHSNDGVEHSCEIVAYSYEHTLTLRSVNLYSQKQSDTDTMVLTLYDILLAFKEQTGWKLPQAFYDSSIYYRTTSRMFEIELNTSWYDFLKSTVQEAFDCFVFFDYENLSVDVKLSYSQTYLRTSDIVLSFDNLIKNITIEETSQRTATALYVTGEDCNIVDVNPLGTSIIYNFTPYLTTDWMSQITVDAITAWQNRINDYTKIYRALVGFRNFLIDYRIAVSTQMTEVDTQIQKYTDLLSLNEGGVSGGLWSRYGECYKLYRNMYVGLEELYSWITYSLKTISETQYSDCYKLLSSLKNYSPALDLLGSGHLRKYEYVFLESSMTGSFNEYQYTHIGLFETIVDEDGNINIFKLNNNPYGTQIIEYYTKNSSVPTIPYITNQLSWENSFSKSQLKEISKYIIDASYSASEYTYYNGVNYTDYINPFECQIGCVRKTAGDGMVNPDDKFTYGLGYWTTPFIPLPSGDDGLSLKFFNKETGELITPYAVNLYNQNKTAVIYFCNDTNNAGYTLNEYWNNNSGRFSNSDGSTSKPMYLRASFKYPYEISNIESVVPIMSVACTLNSEHKNIISTNINNQIDLMQTAQRKHEELCLPCRSFSINIANFLQLEEYTLYAKDLSLGTELKTEIELGKYEDVRLLELSFSFDEVDSLSATFANKYGVDNDKIMFRKLIGSTGDTFDIQDSFTSFSYSENALI